MILKTMISTMYADSRRHGRDGRARNEEIALAVDFQDPLSSYF
jgi:hypothetical protein